MGKAGEEMTAKLYDYKCDICKNSLSFDYYYNKTDNLKFKPNIILTICEKCSLEVKNFIHDMSRKNNMPTYIIQNDG